MQALRITQTVSPDGYLHIQVPPQMGNRCQIIVLPLNDMPQEKDTIADTEVEWDVDYDDAKSSLSQTMQTFELLDQECGPEDMNKWK